MRKKNWLEQVRQKAVTNRRRIWVPEQDTNTNWPVCLTCGKEVDAVSLENVSAFSCEILAKCHGKEDFYIVNFPYRIDGDVLEDDRANWAIKRAMSDFCAFPRGHEE